MNAISLNNLWSYLQGLSLTASNQRWLANHLMENTEARPPLKRWAYFLKRQKQTRYVLSLVIFNKMTREQFTYYIYAFPTTTCGPLMMLGMFW